MADKRKMEGGEKLGQEHQPPSQSSPRSFVQNMDEDEIRLVVTVVLGLIMILFVVCVMKLRKKSKSILLVGVSDSGKTTLFTKLVYKSNHRTMTTFTSMMPNVGEMVLSSGLVKIIDSPGNEKLRAQFIEKFRTSINMIIFVLDSETIQRDLKNVAECLYQVLIDPVIGRSCRRLLILCNKQDLAFAKHPGVVRPLLEREINTLRQTQSGSLEAAEDRPRVSLGDNSTPFQFDHLSPTLKVDFCESELTTTAGDEKEQDEDITSAPVGCLDEVLAWIEAA